jgi:hypothetical protein
MILKLGRWATSNLLQNGVEIIEGILDMMTPVLNFYPR